MFSETSSSLVSKLPTYDLVISMSLMHHVLYQLSAEEAECLIRAMPAGAGFVGIEPLGVIASPKKPACRTLFLARPA